MIDELSKNPQDFFSGYKYSNTTSKDGEYFEYQILNDERKTYGTVINNLIKTQGRTTIKTSWHLDWAPRQVIVDQFGDRFKIQEVVTMPVEVFPQVYLIGLNPSVDFVLSLVSISNPMEVNK